MSIKRIIFYEMFKFIFGNNETKEPKEKYQEKYKQHGNSIKLVNSKKVLPQFTNKSINRPFTNKLNVEPGITVNEFEKKYNDEKMSFLYSVKGRE